MTDYEKPLPVVENEPYAAPFWDALQEEKLVVQECTACDRPQYFPRPWCKYCGSEEIHWRECAGTGTIASYTVVRSTPKSPEFAKDVPYCLALIELEEGVTMPSNVVDFDENSLAIGDPVAIVYDHVTDDVTLPKFELADD